MAGMRRKPATKYNETFFRSMGGPGPTAVGRVVISVVAGICLAFTKSLPFTSPGYELKATFANAVRVSDKAPVRIAGVNVGQVTGLERKGDASVVTFTVTEEGRPIHDDASIRSGRGSSSRATSSSTSIRAARARPRWPDRRRSRSPGPRPRSSSTRS